MWLSTIAQHGPENGTRTTTRGSIPAPGAGAVRASAFFLEPAPCVVSSPQSAAAASVGLGVVLTHVFWYANVYAATVSRGDGAGLRARRLAPPRRPRVAVGARARAQDCRECSAWRFWGCAARVARPGRPWAVRRAAGGGHRGGVARAALAHGGGRCGWPAEVRPTAQIRRTAGSRQPADHVECLTTALRRRTD